VKLKREAAGHYVTADGRFRVVRNPSVAANMWGEFSTPWELTDRDKPAGDFAKLADARKKIKKLMEKK
jgi:hypothetical protein